MRYIMNNLKVSIITPCLNSAATIRQTIESVLSQTYENIEYIIVDGRSTDQTVNIIREYIPSFKGRLKYISEKDTGIYSAMNKGIKLSHGSLIGIINSDDYYENNAVEKVLTYMTGDKYQVIYGYCRVFYNNCMAGILKNQHKDLVHNMIPHPTCFVTRETYQDFGLFLTVFKIASDYEFMFRVRNSGKVNFTQIKDVISNFRLGGKSSDTYKLKCENAIIRYHYREISFMEMMAYMLCLD